MRCNPTIHHVHISTFLSTCLCALLCSWLAPGARAAKQRPVLPDAMDLATRPPAAPPLPLHTGVYVDAAGDRRPWAIGPAHALVWNGAPWVPVGIRFLPSSWRTPARPEDSAAIVPAAAPSAADLKEDESQLEALSRAGITDLLVGASVPRQPADSSRLTESQRLADLPQATLQPVLDAMDRQGMHYGLDLHGTIRPPLEGYSFGESFLVGRALDAGTFAADAPAGADEAMFVARDDTDSVVRMGRTKSVDGAFTAAVPAAVRSVYFVPVRHWGAQEGVANVWDGFAECRDSLLFGLREIKFGPGLRFFLDPMEGPVTPTGRSAYYYPASHHFRIEYEAWLRRRYTDVDTLCERWATAPGAIADFETAARLVPDSATPTAVWDPDKGAVIPLGSAVTTFWSDFEAFRSEATRHQMDLLASSLRHNIADVPVIYSWQRFSKIYASSVDPVTLDGLAVRATAPGEDAIKEAAYACAQVADAPQSFWYMMYAPGARWSLGRLASLVDLGVKGFFLDLPDGKLETGTLDSTVALCQSLRASLTSAPEPPAVYPASARRPEDHSGSRDRKGDARVKSEVKSDRKNPAAGPAGTYADYWPSILWFPWDMQVASVRRFENGTWWLPSFRSGQPLPVGPELEAYLMPDANNGGAVIWSAVGSRMVHLRLTKDAKVSWPPDLRLGRASHGLTPIPLGETPVVLQGAAPQDLFPEEALDRAIQQADQLRSSLLIEQQNQQQLALAVSNARHLQQAGMTYDAYIRLSAALDMQRRILLPYVWLEGEKAAHQNFSGIFSSSQCSGGAYLWLNSPDPPPPGRPYAASWSINIGADAPGLYQFWLGGTPPGEDWSSPVTWMLDGAPLLVQGHGAAGPPYRPLFHWSPLGELKLTAGSHTLTAVVSGPRLEPDHSYFLGIDAIVFSPTPEVAREYLQRHGTLPGDLAVIEHAARPEQ